MFHRWLCIVVSVLALASTVHALQKKAKVIAHVAAVTVEHLDAFEDNTMTGEPVDSFFSGDKVVMLTKSTSVARILLGNGNEAFVNLEGLKPGEEVTLAGAMSRVKYFEKMATESLDPSYWEKLGAPWVALVARELANRPGVALLPPPTSEFEDTYSPPSLTVTNNTGYTVRVYMTGARTLSKTISPGASWNSEFPAGSYRVVAEATAGDVVPLRTTWRLQQGYRHTVTLYVKTTIR